MSGRLGRTGARVAGGWGALLALMVLFAPSRLAGQDLANFDYENLSFRGLGLEIGYLFPDRIENTPTYSVRFDLGYLGPGLRLVPSFSYWSTPFEASEVMGLEERVASLVSRETGAPPPLVDLGTMRWTDYSIGVDGHVVWAVPFDLLTFAGVGVSAHLLNGSGPAIDDTFIEDLLDTVTAGINLHLGLEYPVNERFRVMGQGRYEVIEDLQYFQLRLGWQIMFGPAAPGEVPGR
jgi:hypothetical protein